MAFENFFSIYNMVEPPIKYKDRSDLEIPDIEKTNITQYPMVTTIDNPITITDIDDYPEITSPFDMQIEEPLKKPEGSEDTPKDKASAVVDLARSFLNKPYVYGSMNPDKGFDCSGLINYVYQQVGVSLPRTSHDMAKSGKEVSLSDVQPGDIIYTTSRGPSGGHVKMVSNVSDGQVSVIEAKGKKWGIVESPLTDTSNIKAIRRVLNSTSDTSGPKEPTTQNFSSQKEFVNVMTNAYKKALRNKGLSEDYATILVAQDAGECSWGKDVKGNFNYGNITTNGSDWHTKTGKRRWKDFSSIDDYVNYKIDFLSNKRYNFFNSFSPNSNIKIAMQTLANRGYDSTNPNYGKLVSDVHKSVLKFLS